MLTITCSLGSGASAPVFIAPAGKIALVSTPTEAPVVLEDTPTLESQAINDPPPTSEPTPEPQTEVPILYRTQAGDTLPVVAIRFGVQSAEITSPDPLPETSVLPPNQLLLIPHRLANTTPNLALIPDSELVYSPSAVDFDIRKFVKEAGGYLSSYQEYLKTTSTTTGADIVGRVALENSVNPRLLLALLEYQSSWVYGQPGNLAQQDYPLGYINLNYKGLYKQLVWAVNHLSVGYYGWREGLVTEIKFPNGVTTRLAPDLNAGTVALQYYFSKIYDTNRWVQALDMQNGFPALFSHMFGNPWLRAMTVEPLYPPGLVQPPMILPFFVDQMWSFSGGPHGAWEQDGALAALDFAPGSTESGCVKSDTWAAAAAAGLVVRSGNGVVALDMDGDGYEQTGWVLIYLHVLTNGRAPLGKWVEAGDPIGHPSCEGGHATGTHIHIARKYNGEWIPADGPMPFNLSGWIAHAGSVPYEGSLTKDGITIPASVYGTFESRIIRDK